MEDREFLKELKALIIELNSIAPDVAELELKNNSDASRRVIIALTAFENKSFPAFKNGIKNLRRTILYNKKVNK